MREKNETTTIKKKKKRKKKKKKKEEEIETKTETKKKKVLKNRIITDGNLQNSPGVWLQSDPTGRHLHHANSARLNHRPTNLGYGSAC